MALNDRATPPPEAWVNPCYWLTTWRETYSHKVGRPKKKRNRNIGHNKATCKGQGRKATTGGNNAKASGSASRQAQQAEPIVGQDGSCGSGVGAAIGLSTIDGQGGAGVPVTEEMNANRREMGDGIPTQSSAVGGASEWSFKKISPLAEEIILMICKRIQKTKAESYKANLMNLEDDIESNSELLIPTLWSDESKKEKRAKSWREEFEWKRSLFKIDFTFGINAFDLDKDTHVMKYKVSQEHMCEEEVPLNINIIFNIPLKMDQPIRVRCKITLMETEMDGIHLGSDFWVNLEWKG
ncbi:hypothetical protein Tco_0581709 [Tanacetum coccineum]